MAVHPMRNSGRRCQAKVSVWVSIKQGCMSTQTPVDQFRHGYAVSQGRRGWDSNPRNLRSAVFKTAAFNRSATSPGCGPNDTPGHSAEIGVCPRMLHQSQVRSVPSRPRICTIGLAYDTPTNPRVDRDSRPSSRPTSSLAPIPETRWRSTLRGHRCVERGHQAVEGLVGQPQMKAIFRVRTFNFSKSGAVCRPRCVFISERAIRQPRSPSTPPLHPPPRPDAPGRLIAAGNGTERGRPPRTTGPPPIARYPVDRYPRELARSVCRSLSRDRRWRPPPETAPLPLHHVA